MTRNEIEIIEAVRALPSEGYGEYRSVSSLLITVAKVMGYGYRSFLTGKTCRTRQDREQRHKVLRIVKGMEDRGVIRISKSGYMFKLTA